MSGEIDSALERLERAYVQLDTSLADLGISHLRNLHSDPRWEAFLKKMKLDG